MELLLFRAVRAFHSLRLAALATLLGITGSSAYARLFAVQGSRAERQHQRPRLLPNVLGRWQLQRLWPQQRRFEVHSLTVDRRQSWALRERTALRLRGSGKEIVCPPVLHPTDEEDKEPDDLQTL